jgi:probable F420-dependent oxidoreductase
MFSTEWSMPVHELARAAEDRGLHSVYVPEHTHIPTSRRTAPPTGDDELKEEYKHTLDPLVTLAAAAAVTERIRLGTGICVVAQREPIVTAKAVATLDFLSGGRVEFGIGYGWNHEEMENHGIDVKRRRDVVREHMLAMKALWTDDVASFDGEFVHLEPSWSWPKPVQPGGPPILLGGAPGPKLFAHIAEYADGWIPTRESSTTTRRSASTKWCCGSPVAAPTRSSPSSTSTPRSTTSVLQMGSAGQKRRRKGGKPRHMPKVGTATEDRYAIHHERDAVMGNMGVGRRTSPILKWTAVILIILLVVGGVVTLIAIS